MDWITGISKAIDYIEEHITEPTDYARAAKEACSSSFNFQRVFALLCGYTLGDYVQNPDYTCEIWIAVKPKK